jgi:1-acyl-sn-glycerol-3-phosphate acyltransferase
MPRRMTFLAKAEYFDHPVIGLAFRALGIIPIKREGGNASQRALNSAREVLDGRGMLGIYPEGTRSPDGRLHKGHTGVARLALQTGAVVLPVCTIGTAAVQPIGARFPRPGRVEVRIGHPMRWPGQETAAGDPARLRQVTDAIMGAIGELGGAPPLPDYASRNALR